MLPEEVVAVVLGQQELLVANLNQNGRATLINFALKSLTTTKISL
jgi:hypothetical protein